MPKNTVPLTGRVPEPLKEQVSDMANEEQMSQSAMVRELVKDGIEHREADRVLGDTQDSPSEGAAQSTLTAVALYAVVNIVAFPAAAEVLLIGAAAVFAVGGIAGYLSEVVDLGGVVRRVDLRGRSLDEVEDGKAAAASSPVVRYLGGVLMLLALAVIAVSGVL